MNWPKQLAPGRFYSGCAAFFLNSIFSSLSFRKASSSDNPQCQLLGGFISKKLRIFTPTSNCFQSRFLRLPIISKSCLLHKLSSFGSLSHLFFGFGWSVFPNFLFSNTAPWGLLAISLLLPASAPHRTSHFFLNQPFRLSRWFCLGISKLGRSA